MITRLYLDNAFRHHDRTFHFDKGLTGVVGPNESGKSLIVEMIRYALFGSKALRGKAEDYRKLHVELDFTVGETSYTVIRKGAKAELVGIAAGTRPVNEAVQRILGYDLTVFDVANACNQGNIEALSDMRPTERKAMVDRTVGLDMLDELIRFCGSEGNALKREAEAMKRSLIEPVEPEKPEDYRPSAELRVELRQLQRDALRHAELAGLFGAAPPRQQSDLSLAQAQAQHQAARERHREWQELKGYLSHSVTRPQAPGPCPISEDEATLLARQEAREQVLARRRALETERDGLTPERHSTEALDAMEAQHERAERWAHKQRLLAQGMLACPSCDHRWPVAAQALAAFADVTEAVPPALSRQAIAAQRQLIGNRARRDAIAAELARLAIPADCAGDLAALRAHQARLDAYRHALRAWEDHHRDLPRKQARLAELDGAEAALMDAERALEIARNADWWARHAGLEAEMHALSGATERAQQVQAQLACCADHERRMADYRAQLAVFAQHSAEIAALSSRAEEFLTARERITALKLALKSHLLPALNRVASALLAQMTGGARYLIEVDEGFDIRVDGQPVGTLSGSGKAVANLAIRIALGQILTNRVFSLFMADEVDAAMDNERAEHTAEAMRGLAALVSQVILVTHKRPETDVTIELG